jgi:hypothetical protein
MVRTLLLVLICVEVASAVQSDAAAAEARKARTSAVGDCCPKEGDASEELCLSRG